MERRNDNLLDGLVKSGETQVFLMASPVPFPFSFAVHAWFVVNVRDELHRFEFGKFKGSTHPGGVGLLKDFFKPTTGMNCLPWFSRWRYSSRMIGMVSGNENSEAGRLADFLESKSNYYPHKHRYNFLGPNSNTYVGWVLRHFPGCGLYLPKSAIGKDYYSQPVSLTLKKKIRYVDLQTGGRELG